MRNPLFNVKKILLRVPPSGGFGVSTSGSGTGFGAARERGGPPGAFAGAVGHLIGS
jgi:hypothetical protein